MSFLVSILLPCFLILSFSLRYLSNDVFVQVRYFRWLALRASYSCIHCWHVFFCYFVQFPTLLFYVYCVFYTFIHAGEQEWRSDKSARLPPMCPGFDSRTRHHMWVEFVVGSFLLVPSLLREVFLRVLRFSPLLNISKFQFDQE